MKKLGDFILGTLAKKGLGKTALSAQVCFLANEQGNDLFRAESFSRAILKVSVASSAAAQELQMKEEVLIDLINSKMGKKYVKSIRIINLG
ncbi:MAG: DciA family protein [Patescibacteria group bacterium]